MRCKNSFRGRQWRKTSDDKTQTPLIFCLIKFGRIFLGVFHTWIATNFMFCAKARAISGHTHIMHVSVYRRFHIIISLSVPLNFCRWYLSIVSFFFSIWQITVAQRHIVKILLSTWQFFPCFAFIKIYIYWTNWANARCHCVAMWHFFRRLVCLLFQINVLHSHRLNCSDMHILIKLGICFFFGNSSMWCVLTYKGPYNFQISQRNAQASAAYISIRQQHIVRWGKI